MTLLERTQDLLDRSIKSGMTLRDIARQWGEDEVEARKRLDWLRKFTDKTDDGEPKIPNPGVNTIESLHDCLKNLKRKRTA